MGLLLGLLLMALLPLQMWDIADNPAATPVLVALLLLAVTLGGCLLALLAPSVFGMAGFGLMVAGALGSISALIGGNGAAYAVASLIAVVGGILIQQVGGWTLRSRQWSADGSRRSVGPLPSTVLTESFTRWIADEMQPDESVIEYAHLTCRDPSGLKSGTLFLTNRRIHWREAQDKELTHVGFSWPLERVTLLSYPPEETVRGEFALTYRGDDDRRLLFFSPQRVKSRSSAILASNMQQAIGRYVPTLGSGD